jgi:alginate O-acetyltransferase complex protein AlgI
MVFSSSVFLFLFLPVVLAFYFLSPKKIKNLVLLIASLFFYAWGEVQYIWVLIISIIGNYFFGIWVGKFLDEKKSINLKFVISAAVIFNLALLGYYKYANFLIDNFNHVFN